MFAFKFEGKFVDIIEPIEAKVLALHEIAHFNSFMSGSGNYGHGDWANELSFMGLFRKEGITYNQVNAAIKSIHKKWEQFQSLRK